ncbi:conserved repeat domain-containing protein/fimbrial isopeptide formation D2 domain-containing protein [Collimonas sp. OK307]|uniref:DUF7933 domain-containing protein n=1 Tax=Collimonas sp. OK307 TaxID=1801620 RepID=UPI0008F2AB7E|nr:DUF11 domain-containing protein [Collimonas sp. OK307]SFI04174.1 conserved repeat domain-containing protein/fimbrial isopeptide formation D2 domain-containing protein [Collimonas sp. OK307]
MGFLRRIEKRKSLFAGILFVACSSLWSGTVFSQVTGVNKSFNPVQIQDRAPFNVSHLSIVIANQTPGQTLTNFNLTDNLPPGVTVAANPNIQNACGATLSATPGATLVTVAGGQAQFGDICTFQVDVVASTAGIYTNTIPAGVALADGQTVPQAASASLTVIRRDTGLPQVSAKAFSPNSILSGQTSTMTITLNNTNILPLTNTNLNDTFPAGMTIANAGATTTCGGTLNAAPGDGQFSLVGGTIPAGGTCTVTMQVVGDIGIATGTVNLSNTIKAGDLTSLNGQVTPPLANAGATTGTLAVTARPADRLTKSFSVASAFVGQAFSMTWTIYNDTGTAWTGLGVTDTLPAGLALYTNPTALSTTCAGGAVTSQPGNNVRLAGGSLPAGQSCTVTAKVVGTTAGAPVNTIPANAIQTTQGISNPLPASATVTLNPTSPGQNPTLQVGKSFTQLITEAALDPAGALAGGHAPGTVTGGLIDMSVTLTKVIPAGGVNIDLQPLTFADNWAGTAPNLRVFSTVSNSCGGTLVATAGSQAMTLTNGVVPQASTNCVVRLRLKADTALLPPTQGTPQSNTVNACTGAGPCSPGSPSAIANALIVGSPPLFPAKSFNPTTLPLNGTTKATITIQNPASTTRFNLKTVDTLPAGLMFATPLAAAVSCTSNPGVTPTFQTSGKTLTFLVSQLSGFNNSAAPPSCTITFNVAADTSSPLAVPGATATNSILANAVTATDSSGTPDPSATNIKPADANVQFVATVQAPQVSKGFNPIVIFQENGNGKIDSNIQGTGVGELTTLTLQIINPNSPGGPNLTGVNMSDTLPAGLVFAFVPNVTRSSCGAPTITAPAGGQTISITNATVPAGTSCVVTVDVIGNAKGNLINTVPANAVQTAQGVTNASPASATLTVLGTTPISSLFKDVTQTGSATSIQGVAIVPGELLTYNLKLSNPGYLPLTLATDVRQVSDVIPAGTTFVSAGGAVPGVLSAGKVTWDLTSSPTVLARSQFITLTLNVRVNTPATASIINVATTPTQSSCGPYDGAACTFTPPVPNCQIPADPLKPTPAELANPAFCHPVVNPIAKPSLQVFKSHSGNFTAGAIGSYTLTVSNIGGTPTTGAIHLSDLLPAGMSLAAGSVASSSGTITNIVSNGQALAFDFTPTTPIAAAGSVTVTFNVNVAATATGTLTNYAGITGGGDPAAPVTPGAACNDSTHCSSDPTVINPVPFLKLSKAHSGSFAAGSTGNYTLTITNTGGTPTTGALSISDRLPTGISLVNGSVTSGGGSVSNVAINGQTVTFNLTPTAPIPAAGSITVTYAVNVAAASSGTLINYAAVSGGGDPTPPPTPGASCSDTNHCANDSTAITPLPLLKIVKTHTGSLTNGSSTTYNLAISNIGGAPTAGAIKISDLLPTGVTVIAGAVTSSGGGISNVAISGQNMSFSLTPTAPLAPGASITVSYLANIAATAKGNLINYVSVAGGGDPTPPTTPGVSCNDANHCGNDAAAITVAPDLKLQKTHSGNFTAGSSGSYTVTISNNGQNPTSGAIHVADLLPAGMSLVSGSVASGNGSIGNIVSSGQGVTFDLTPATPLAAGASIAVTYSVNIAATISGTLTNYASVSGGGDPTPAIPPGASCADATHCSNDQTTIIAVPALSIVKAHTGSFTAGSSASYTLTISNTKGGPTTSAIHVNDLLPNGMTLITGSLASSAGSISNVVSNAQNVTFDFTPATPIVAGASVMLTYGVDVAPTASGTLTNYVSVAGGGDPASLLMPGAACNDSIRCSSDATQIANASLLVLTKAASVQEAELGDMVTYTVTVTNTGAAAVVQPNIIDRLPPGFRLINNSTHVSGATLVRQDGAPGPVLTTVLDIINPHSSVTMTYRVRLGVGSMNGDGINRVTATCPRNSNVNCGNEARAKVRVTGGVFTNDACFAGMIFVDCNGNQIKDKEELGIPGVRLYVEDGTFLVSDVEGKYSFCGLPPKTHVLKVDQTTLPRGSRLVVSSNRNVGDAGSLFLDLKNGELQRADFIEGSCSNPVLEQVKARRTQGEISAPQIDKKRGPGFKFEGKAPDYPQQGTDSANQTIVKPRIKDAASMPPVPDTNSERDTPLQDLEMNQGASHAQ